ncbi:MAG TPA: hypothetical protein VGP82_08030 [Ktedonobacterales bacterium]|nr:hypothetical protein [Ktedonobacterales bacterium]
MDDEPRWHVPSDVLNRLRQARRVMALSGAGISAESGLSTLHDLETGYWSTFNSDDLASRRGFERNPGASGAGTPCAGRLPPERCRIPATRRLPPCKTTSPSWSW